VLNIEDGILKMRVNNINASPNFGRVIRLQDASGKDFEAKDRQFGGSIAELYSVLNSSYSPCYSKDEGEKLRAFFKRILGDYDGKRGIIIEKTRKGMYLISGKDAEEIRQLKHECYEKNKRQKEAGKGQIKDDAKRSAVFEDVNREIEARCENGRYLSRKNKPNTRLELELDPSSAPNRPKFGKLTYEYYLDSRREGPDPFHRKVEARRTIGYDFETLEL